MKVGMISLGCPKNLTDTENVLGLLVEAGYRLTNQKRDADILIINTCAFIGDAMDESLSTIRDAIKLKTKGKLKYLVVVGCLPKRSKETIFDDFPEVDAIVSPAGMDRIVSVLRELNTGRKVSILDEGSCLFTHTSPKIKATPSYYAYIKISDGCNNRCAYCVVPSLRGPYQSRRIESIVEEVKGLVKKGLKEAILVAQDTTNYGKDLYGKPMLHILCKKLARIKDLKWIRIMYAHPAHVTKELIKVIKEEPKICKYLDLPIQHACDNILESMRRRYSARNLKLLLEKLKGEIPGIAIRTSVIVGFPGEKESDFRQLLSFVKESGFTRLGVFKYSRQSGTPAAEMRGQISEKVKARRFHELMRIQQKISKESLKNMVGKVLMVLTEGKLGRSYMDAPDIDGAVLLNKVSIGEVRPVLVTGSSDYDLSGKFVT